jgi:hypothetical protein
VVAQAPASRRVGVIGICILAGGAGLVTAFLSADAFTLRWQHSVEHTSWEEDYRVEGTRLVLAEARVQGSGAGMEPPAGAELDEGAWRYRPDLPALAELRLAVSPWGDHELCVARQCWPLSRLAGVRDGDSAVAVVRPCAVGG